jgi:hypothetical protein
MQRKESEASTEASAPSTMCSKDAQASLFGAIGLKSVPE